MSSPPTPPTLVGARLILRRVAPADVADRLCCGRDPEFVLMCGGDPQAVQPLSQAEAEAWYAHMRAEPHGWAIQAEGRCVGSARLHSLQPEDRRARYAIGLFDRRAWGQGYGSEATRLVLQYAFETLGLHRVDLRVLAFNRRAIACYESCGFVVEGIERESARIGDAWHSDLMMSVLEDEYRRRSEADDHPAGRLDHELAARHSYLYQEGRWQARGFYWDAAGCRSPLEAETHCRHTPESWVLEGTLRVLADPAIEISNRYEIAPPTGDGRRLAWRAHNPALGTLAGSFTVVGDTILSAYGSSDGRYQGSECLLRYSCAHYEGRGALLQGDRVYSAWVVTLTRSA